MALFGGGEIVAVLSDLTREYLRAGVVDTKMRVDAKHIAVATPARVDVLVSWNFKHIVNLRRIQGYNLVMNSGK